MPGMVKGKQPGNPSTPLPPLPLKLSHSHNKPNTHPHLYACLLELSLQHLGHTQWCVCRPHKHQHLFALACKQPHQPRQGGEHATMLALIIAQHLCGGKQRAGGKGARRSAGVCAHTSTQPCAHNTAPEKHTHSPHMHTHSTCQHHSHSFSILLTLLVTHPPTWCEIVSGSILAQRCLAVSASVPVLSC